MTTQPLDERVAQSLYVATRFEQALHDEGPWTMTWGPHVVEAVRTIEADGVSFTAVFPEACYLNRPEPNVALRCRGEVVAIRVIEHPGDAAFAITWELAQMASA